SAICSARVSSACAACPSSSSTNASPFPAPSRSRSSSARSSTLRDPETVGPKKFEEFRGRACIGPRMDSNAGRCAWHPRRMRSASFVSLSWIVALSVFVACDCGGGTPDPFDPAPDATPGDDGAAPDCESLVACGSTCCGEGEFCGSNLQCCAFTEACGTSCCGEGEVCEAASCRLACGEDETRCTDAEGVDTCCAADELCVSGGCFAPTTACTEFFDCPPDQYCEPSIEGGVCLPQPGGEACQAFPSGADVQPLVKLRWPRRDGNGDIIDAIPEPDWVHVMMTPMVANLNDDNGDGVIDEKDVPDIVFNTFNPPLNTNGSYNRNGILRAVSGADGTLLFS